MVSFPDWLFFNIWYYIFSTWFILVKSYKAIKEIVTVEIKLPQSEDTFFGNINRKIKMKTWNFVFNKEILI